MAEHEVTIRDAEIEAALERAKLHISSKCLTLRVASLA